MPQQITSDEYYDDLMNVYGLEQNQVFAEQILTEAKNDEKSPLWEWTRQGEYGQIADYMYEKGYDVPDNVYENFVDTAFEGISDLFNTEADEYYPDAPFDFDQSFNTGAEFAGSLQIAETENEKVYVPSSYYCHTKVYNKFLELQTRGEKVIPLEAKGVNPYAMKKNDFLNHIMKYIIKCDCISVDGEKRCDNKCAVSKRKQYDNKKTGNEYYKNNSTTEPYDKENPANYMKPSICRVWYDEEKKRVEIKPINKAAQSHPTMCIGLIYLAGTTNCHAILIKDYTKGLTTEDITIKLTKTKELYPGFKKFMPYMYKDPKPYAIPWDIETSVYVVCDKNGTYSYKFNPSAIRYKIVNVIERKAITENKRIFLKDAKEDDGITIFDEFFKAVKKDCNEHKITDASMWAHNSGGFDSIFAKRSKVVKFEKEISCGNKIKTLKISIGTEDTKVNLTLLDTLPFTLQPLKDACKTFQTEIHKEEFDIIDKSWLWYKMNSSQESYDEVMNNMNLKREYMCNYMDMYMKVNYNTGVKEENMVLKYDKKYSKQYNEAKLEELKRINSGYKNWDRYLTYDVDSLTDLIFKVEDMYNDFGFSITNYVGLPGIAMDMMNSYCYNLSKLYVPSDPSMVELCKASCHGGKVLHFKREWDSPLKSGVKWDSNLNEFTDEMNKVIKDGIYEDYLICLDMNSLYPSVMHSCAFPIGKPELVSKEVLEANTWNDYAHYIGEFRVTAPNIRYAIHPYKTDKGALIYPSNQTFINVYNDVDVREMLKDGYKIEMIKGIYWKKGAKIFTELIGMIYSKRAFYKSLNPSDPNYSKEYICKIMMNAMFGKFNETIRNLVKYFSGDEDQLKALVLKNKARYSKMDNGQYRINETLTTPKISKPTYIAGYITAYSRALVNELIREVGVEKIYYSDTDSLYMRYSDFQNAKLNCTNGLCGFKNDYGDGVMITKARFLDIKRCYFEFRTKVDSECFDKWGKHRLSCEDPITKKINTGAPYFVKTFKFKYTGINFRDIVSSSTLEPDNKLYAKKEISHEEYNAIMSNTSRIVDKFLGNNEKNKATEDKKEIESIKLLMRRFKKSGFNVSINISEFAFVITPEKRGKWENGEFYALGFDKNAPEEFLCKTGKVGDLVNRFVNCLKVNYGMMVDGDKKIIRSRRPLFYNIRMHIMIIKDKAEKLKTKINSNNEYINTLNSLETKQGDYIQKIFDEYLKYVDDVKAGVEVLDRNKNGKYCTFLGALSSTYIEKASEPNLSKKVNLLINNDVVFDKNNKYDTDYYIEFFDEIPASIKHEQNNKSYRILAKYSKFGKEGKINEYFIPNFINVKGRASNINMEKLYPVIMLSTRFNEQLGNNNLDNWQSLALVSNFI